MYDSNFFTTKNTMGFEKGGKDVQSAEIYD